MLEVLKAFEGNEYRGGFSMEYVDARSFRNPEKWDRQTVEQFESLSGENVGGNSR